MAKRKSKKKIFLIDAAILIVVAIALAISMAWSLDIELALGLAYYEDAHKADAAQSGVYISESASPQLKLHFVNVWQGDCTIIELPDGKTMIIDGGENNKRTEAALDAYITAALPDGFKYFDYAILTHSDSDHCGSLDYVLEKYPARVSYRPNVEASKSGFTDPGKDDLTTGASKKDTTAYKNVIEIMYADTDDFTPTVYVTDPAVDEQTITGGSGDDAYTYTFYSPLSDKYSDSNNYSPIMILEYRGFKFALSGDAEAKNEEEFVAKVAAAKTDGVNDKYDAFTDDYCVNLVKLGHHGSRTSSSQEYLDIITTADGAKSAYYIISSNREGNNYGHPHDETLERLANMGVPTENILRTDTLGDISLCVRVDENGVYSLYYGDTATGSGKGSGDNIGTGDNTDDDKKEQVLVYVELFGIKLKWAVVGWTLYAVLIVAAGIHMAITVLSDGNTNKSGGARRKKPSRGKRG